MELTNFRLKTPDTYYVTSRENGKIKSRKIKADKITSKLFPNADLFIHEYENGWRISDGYSSSWMVQCPTKNATILLLCNKLRGKRFQNGGLERVILNAIYTNGLSPRYEVIKDEH